MGEMKTNIIVEAFNVMGGDPDDAINSAKRYSGSGSFVSAS